jgi:hypothetical protein
MVFFFIIMICFLKKYQKKDGLKIYIIALDIFFKIIKEGKRFVGQKS